MVGPAVHPQGLRRASEGGGSNVSTRPHGAAPRSRCLLFWWPWAAPSSHVTVPW